MFAFPKKKAKKSGVNGGKGVVFTDLVSSQCFHIVVTLVATASSIFSRAVTGCRAPWR
jgi:hypothetical protein